MLLGRSRSDVPSLDEYRPSVGMWLDMHGFVGCWANTTPPVTTRVVCVVVKACCALALRHGLDRLVHFDDMKVVLITSRKGSLDYINAANVWNKSFGVGKALNFGFLVS